METKNIIPSVRLVLIVLITAFVVDKLVYFSIKKISSEVYSGQTVGKLNQYISSKDSLETIVFGSSRANHHINPQKLSNNSFNMGMDGQFIAYFSTLIKLLPEKKSQNVILHLDPYKLFDDNYKGNDIKSLSIKYHENDIIKRELNESGKMSFLNSFFWTLDYNRGVLGIIRNFFIPKYDYQKYNGYDPLILSKTQVEIRNKTLKKALDGSCGSLLKKNRIFLEYLQEIKEFCNKNDKDLFIISSPIFRDNCIKDNIALAEILDSLNIDYRDYTQLFFEKDSLDFWKDNIHLSSSGAEIFTEKLQKDLFKGRVKN